MKINLIEYFESTVTAYPDRIAVVDEAGSWSFRELQEQSIALGAIITERYHCTNRPVAIYLPKAKEAIAVFVGILYSGNCYAPLDPKAPSSKIRAILNSLGPICLVTNSQMLEKLGPVGLDLDVLNLDELEINETEPPAGYQKCIDQDPAYILHTSGSTGLPKGVVISHLSIIDYLNWVVDAFDISEEDRVGNQTPFIFDMSTLDIYLMIFRGASLHLIPESCFVFPAPLLEYLNSHAINLVFWVPSVFVNIANLRLLDSIPVATLRKVLFGGEVMPPKHLEYWIQRLQGQGVVYGNLYGPTEITGTCACYIVDSSFDPESSVPIGKPCRNTAILLLNDNDQACGVGETGEVCVRGSCLALGYWNDPIKTASVFVQNPLNPQYFERIYRTGDLALLREDGQLIYVGRKDFQIKLHGYRIDLGEVEHHILSVFDTINAGVAFDENKREIVLFYEAGTEIEVREFRLKLSKVLSKQMIPTRYERMESLPKSPTGKIDRALLKEKVNGGS